MITIRLLSLMTSALLLTACENIFEPIGTTTDNPAQTPDTNTTLVVQSGVFVGAPVSGLRYTTYSDGVLNMMNYTDSQGVFHYAPGDTISFQIGDLSLSSPVEASKLISPLTLTGETSTADTLTANMSRLLQTLDDDDNTSNGISISSDTDSNATATTYKKLDFGVDTGTFATASDTLNDNFEVLNGKTITLLNSAIAHLNDNLNLEFNTTAIAGTTYTSLWDQGTHYSVYAFDSPSIGLVTIQEEDRYDALEANITGTWSINSGIIYITRDTVTPTDENLSRLATSNSDTHITANSLSAKDLGVFRSAPQTFTTADINGSQMSLLSPTGDYAMINFTDIGTATGLFPEESNVSLSWSIGSDGNVTTSGTVNGVVRQDSMLPLVHRNLLYKIHHTLDINATLIHTDQKATLGKESSPLFDSMIPGTFYCVNNFGLSFTLTLDSNYSGSISYQRDDDITPFGTGYGDTSISWSIDGLNRLVLNNVTNYDGVTPVSPILQLKSASNKIYLVQAIAGFVQNDEKIIMYRKPEVKTVSEISGTYAIVREDYNNTSGTVVKYTSTYETRIHFNTDYTGYMMDDTNLTHSNFTWDINDDGSITRNGNGTTPWSSILTIFRDYRNTLRIGDRYTTSTLDVKQYYYTFIKQ